MYQIVSNELYHHGIKGQKWGVRRFQNPDGTLTEAGKERYEKYTKIAQKEAFNIVNRLPYMQGLQNMLSNQLDRINNGNFKERINAKQEKEVADAIYKSLYSQQISSLKRYKKAEDFCKIYGKVPLTFLEINPRLKTLYKDSPYNK